MVRSGQSATGPIPDITYHLDKCLLAGSYWRVVNVESPTSNVVGFAEFGRHVLGCPMSTMAAGIADGAYLFSAFSWQREPRQVTLSSILVTALGTPMRV